MSTPSTALPLAHQIRHERLRLGWTQAEMAERSGVPIATYARFERNGRTSLTRLLKITAALGLELIVVNSGAGPTPVDDPRLGPGRQRGLRRTAAKSAPRTESPASGDRHLRGPDSAARNTAQSEPALTDSGLSESRVSRTSGAMKDIQELQRLASPAPKPQSLAWDGSTLWMGSRQTHDVFAIDPATWKVRWQTKAPGTPYGMTLVDGELRVLCGESADDNRIIRRCIPYHGFDTNFALPCPEDTGSQLSFDGHRLYVSQWYPKKVLRLGDSGQVERTMSAPHEICGQVYVAPYLYLLTTDDEETNDYWLTRLDPRPATPTFEDLVRIPFAARALAFDGTHFWTNHREQNQIVQFPRAD